MPTGAAYLFVSSRDSLFGDNSDTDANFQLVIGGPMADDVLVDFTTSDDTAVAAGDFTPVSGTASITAGFTTKTVAVQTTQDVTSEGNESFTLDLSNLQEPASLVDAQGLGTIIGDDLLPAVLVSDPFVTEGGDLTFTLSLNRVATTDAVIDFQTGDLTATAGADYTAAAGTATITAGTFSTNVVVSTASDTALEGTETVALDLTLVSGDVVLSESQGVGSLLDVTASVADTSVPEGNTATFTVSLSRSAVSDVTLDYSTIDDSAVAGSGFVATSGSVTIAQGTSSTTLAVATIDDAVDEQFESFTLRGQLETS